MKSLKNRAIAAIKRLRDLETVEAGRNNGGYDKPNHIRKYLNQSVPLCEFIENGWCNPTKESEFLIAELETELNSSN